MKRKKAIFFLCLLAVLLGLIFYAPHYLAYSDRPKKVDAVVLLLGQDFKARKKQSRFLINEGYSDYLIIPAYSRLYKASAKRTLLLTQTQRRKGKDKQVYQLYEDTHLEILHAKTIMDKYGFRSAIFVSSPYHMRRVKLIADRVFEGKDRDLFFDPTRYEEMNNTLWWRTTYHLRWVIAEYFKIGWFLLYKPFI